MTCLTEIRRRYPTPHEAWGYLAQRGFRCRPDASWVNGRWVAMVKPLDEGVDVTVWLRHRDV
jgi:hypothetical protein